MEKVLPDIEKIIVPDKDSGNMLNLLNLNTGKTAGGRNNEKFIDSINFYYHIFWLIHYYYCR